MLFNLKNLQIIPATLEDYPIIQNMGRFYVYDMSEYMGFEPGWEIPSNGLYECIDFKKYWEDPNAFPFLIRYRHELAGFFIVDKKGSDPTIDYNMAQFFILRKFKSKGVGNAIAITCFKKFSGIWEVMVELENTGAYRFWKKIISEFTGNNFTEYTKKILHLKTPKNIFRFST
ncbi:MAG: GNAT family N-acetyltransferase [Candidatus Berkiellales bacterium]